MKESNFLLWNDKRRLIKLSHTKENKTDSDPAFRQVKDFLPGFGWKRSKKPKGFINPKLAILIIMLIFIVLIVVA
jgi:hypothetical protein